MPALNVAMPVVGASYTHEPTLSPLDYLMEKVIASP